MQNSSESISLWRGTTTSSNLNPLGTFTETWIAGGATRNFAFTGFGPSTDVERKLATAGTYDKSYYRGPYGRRWYDDTYWSTWNKTFTNGYLGGVYGDYLSSYPGVTSANLVSNNMMNWVYNECLDKFYEKVKKSETNIALTLGEGRETGRMFKALRSVDSIVKAIRKSRKLLKTNPSLLLAQTHLSIKYGWQPLLNDVWNYANWTYETFSLGVPIKARRRKRFKVSDIRYPQSYQRSHVRGEETYSCEIEVVCYVDDPNWFTVSRLTSLNPASIAWELTTLSFVVDWLYDVGGYLENLENSLATGLSFRRGYVTRTYHQNLTDYHYRFRTAPASPPAAGGTRDEMWGTSIQQKASKSRIRLTGFPRPVKPTLKLRMGSGRILSAVALARTILLGKVK